MSLRIDLSREIAQAKAEYEQILDEKFGPAVLQEIKAAWPTDTGASKAQWSWDGTSFQNDSPYAEDVKQRGQNAVETIVNPIIAQAAKRPWRS